MVSLLSINKDIIGCVFERLDEQTLSKDVPLVSKKWREISEKLLKRIFESEFNNLQIAQSPRELVSLREKYLFNRMVRDTVTTSWIQSKPAMTAQTSPFISYQYLPESGLCLEQQHLFITADFPLSYDPDNNSKLLYVPSTKIQGKTAKINPSILEQDRTSSRFNNLIARVNDKGNVSIYQTVEKTEIEIWEYDITHHGKINFLTFTPTGALFLLTDKQMFLHAVPDITTKT